MLLFCSSILQSYNILLSLLVGQLLAAARRYSFASVGHCPLCWRLDLIHRIVWRSLPGLPTKILVLLLPQPRLLQLHIGYPLLRPCCVSRSRAPAPTTDSISPRYDSHTCQAWCGQSAPLTVKQSKAFCWLKQLHMLCFTVTAGLL